MKHRGVTLLELLVAITLLGFISVSLVFALRIGLSSWQRGNSRMSADRRVIAAADLFARQVAAIRPAFVSWGPKEHQIRFLYFDGAPDRLRFLTSYSFSGPGTAGVPPAFWLAEYFFTRDKDGACSLLYNEWPFRRDADAAHTVKNFGNDPATGKTVILFAPAERRDQTRELYHGLKNCGFEYLTEPPASRDRQGAEWGREWETYTILLPRAVAARFVGHEEGGIAPVAMVAGLPLREFLP